MKYFFASMEAGKFSLNRWATTPHKTATQEDAHIFAPRMETGWVVSIGFQKTDTAVKQIP